MENAKSILLLVLVGVVVYILCNSGKKEHYISTPNRPGRYTQLMHVPVNMGSSQYTWPRTGGHWWNLPQINNYPLYTYQCNMDKCKPYLGYR